MARSAPVFWRSRSLAAVFLLPLAGVFSVLAALRRLLYRAGLLRSVRLPVPVIVVGNIAVGGSGKTPVVDWLVARLCENGYRPAIVSRGYGGSLEGCAIVAADGDAAWFGDEPLLLARLTGVPVAVGRDRPAAARMLLERHPECDVIVCDDGLQHYRLARDIEIVVLDEAVLGNRWPLPAGPLREGLGRLREATLLITHGEVSAQLAARIAGLAHFPMRLAGRRFRSLADPAVSCEAGDFAGRRVHALAGIGRPERFFAQLESLGLEVVRHPFPDHHSFVAADLDFGDGGARVMTSKDAVKCASFAPPDSWEFPVVAEIGAGAAERILENLRHGSSTA